MNYIKSPINYNGNKFRQLKNIIPLFPKKINTFVDLFGGSGTVMFNVEAERYVYNDINPFISEIVKGILSTDYADIITKIENLIAEYRLSKTNKEGFSKLREYYNSGNRDWITLYTLMIFSFNNQFRFNNNHEYNSSFGLGRSDFNLKMRDNLRQVKLHQPADYVILNKSFSEFDFTDFDFDDLIYCDPPYYGSIGNYNDGKRGFEGWTIEHEKKLLEMLDFLNERKIRFALSNNLKYDNPLLKEWIKKYKVYCTGSHHANCNHQKKDKTADVEVLIVNY